MILDEANSAVMAQFIFEASVVLGMVTWLNMRATKLYTVLYMYLYISGLKVRLSIQLYVSRRDH
jgi:hypothetical protein